MDSIKAKLPFTHEHDDDEDDSFDVIGYWAITALSWSVPFTLSRSKARVRGVDFLMAFTVSPQALHLVGASSPIPPPSRVSCSVQRRLVQPLLEP